MVAAEVAYRPRGDQGCRAAPLTPWRGPSRNPAMSSDDKRVYIFDTTLRDGAQTQGVDFGVGDKLAIAQALETP